jgi:hypothetical protein
MVSQSYFLSKPVELTIARPEYLQEIPQFVRPGYRAMPLWYRSEERVDRDYANSLRMASLCAPTAGTAPGCGIRPVVMTGGAGMATGPVGVSTWTRRS